MEKKQPYTPKNKNNSNEFRQLIDAWLSYCVQEELSDRTIAHYSDTMTRFLWWWTAHTAYNKTLGNHPRHVTVKEAREFVLYLKEPSTERWGSECTKPLSPATIAGYGRNVKVFFNWCEREGYIEQTPINKSVKFTTKRKQEKEIKNVSRESLTQIFSALTQPSVISTFAGKRDLALISLFLDSGVRRGELLSMSLADLDMVKMRLAVNGKTGPRTAHFSERCKGVLLDYLKARTSFMQNEPESPLWLSVDGLAMGRSAFDSLMARLKKRCGVDFHAHQLRHTYALLMSKKVSLFELRDLLGHSSITTTQIYVQNNPETLGNVYRPSSPLTVLEDELPGIKRRGRPRKTSFSNGSDGQLKHAKKR